MHTSMLLMCLPYCSTPCLQVGTLAVSAGGEVAGVAKGVGSRVVGVGSLVAGAVKKQVRPMCMRMHPKECRGRQTCM